MPQIGYPGIVRNGAIVLLDSVNPLAEGTRVSVTPEGTVRGSGTAIVAALDTVPRVPKEWVDELERLIRERGQPPLLGGELSEEPGVQA
jgi:hypothetical protein